MLWRGAICMMPVAGDCKKQSSALSGKERKLSARPLKAVPDKRPDMASRRLFAPSAA
jgi:hypothetical protein